MIRPSGYVILSNSEQGFWSNDMGWVYDLASATRFPSLPPLLPISTGQDAVVMPVSTVGADFEPN